MAALNTIEVSVGGKLLADVDQVSKEIADVAETVFEGQTPVLQKLVREFMDDVYARLQQAHGSPWQPGGSGSNLYSRSGQGLRDIANSMKVTGSGADVVGSISLTGYMAVQETGATISAKRSKYLTIPLPAAMDSRGISLRRRARDWDDTFVARSKKGNLLIFRKVGRGVVPLYLLKTTVTLKPRLRLKETIDDALPYFERRVFETLSKALGA